jgi:translocation and assembly module TamB
VLAQFDVHRLQVEGGSLDLPLPGGERIVASRIDVRSGTAAAPRSLRSLASVARPSRVALELGPARVEAGGRQMALDRGSLEADLALDLSRLDIRQAEVQGQGLALSVRGQVENLCHPTLAISVSAQGPLPAIFALAGKPGVRSSGSAALEVRLNGKLAAPDIAGEAHLTGARIAQYAPGDLRAAFRLVGQDLVFDRLEVPFADGGSVLAKATLKLGREIGLQAEVETRQVEFAELLSRLGLTGAHVMMRLGTKARLSGTAWPLKLAGEVVVDAQDFRVLSHTWERARPGEEATLEIPKAHLEAPVLILAEGVRLEGARARVGEETLRVDGELFFDDARGFQLAVDGAVDLTALRHVASIPCAGRAAVAGTIRAAPYGNPVIEAKAKTTGFHFLQLDLEQLAATVSYRGFLLSVEDGSGVKGQTRYAVQAAIDLSRTPALLSSGRLSAQGRLRDLFDAVVPWLPSARSVRELVDAEASLEMSGSGGLPAVSAGFDVRLGKGELWGRAFESGRAVGRISRGERVFFERAELRRGTMVASGTGTIAFDPPSPCDLELSFNGARLGELDVPGGPWGGTASGTATLGGSLDEPVLQFSASGDGVSILEVPVGSVQVGGSLRGGRLSLTGSTEGVRFTATAALRGEMPFEAQAELDVEDVTRFIPGGPPAGLRAQVKGEASAEGQLAHLARARARVQLASFHGGYGDFKVDNKEPMVMTVDRGTVEVESFTLVGANTEFALSGLRAATGELDLNAGGSLDLRLLAGLVPALTRTHGRLALDARVTGTGAEPLLVGSGRISDGGFRVRDLPIEFAAMNGELAFSQNQVFFDGLSASINGGRAGLRGEVELIRFVPSRLRVEATVDNAAMTIPSYIPSWISGQLVASGTPDATTLSGVLHVLRAQYTEKWDLDRRMLELGKRPPEQKPYDKSGEWLRFDVKLIVDGDARIENDLMRGAVKGEVTLTGDLANLGLLGSLAITPGGRASFRGNEFNLSRGLVAFTDRYHVRTSLDVYGDATVRDYQVFIHVFGSLDEPQVQLTSSPALSQQDIVTLLSLGYTTRDTTLSQGLGPAATAAAAQALFAVSGLSEQLKRFLPRSGLFQDFSVRVTSAYSQATYQVEPRMEFETKAARNRLRLRYQAPLWGIRGQKAQVEWRFGFEERASVQLQWDNDNPDVGAGSDLGFDLKLRWEWND